MDALIADREAAAASLRGRETSLELLQALTGVESALLQRGPR